MNYSFYLLSNASKILACLVPDSGCISDCFADKEEFVAQAAAAAGLGYGVNDCVEEFSNSEVMCKADNSFGGGYYSQGLFQFADNLNMSFVDMFKDKYCEQEDTYEKKMGGEYIGIYLGAVLAVGCALMFMFNDKLRISVGSKLSSCVSSLFGNNGSAEEKLPFSVNEVPNPAYAAIS